MYRFLCINLFLVVFLFSNGASGSESHIFSGAGPLALNPVLNSTQGNFGGFALSLANKVGGALDGVQLGGLFNYVEKKGIGLQVSSLFNNVGGNMSGVQLSGGVNFVGGRITGIQLAGVSAVAVRGFNGIQASGLLNYSGEYSLGVQGAWGANIAAGGIYGLQGALFMNYAGNGSQILQGGIMNITNRSRSHAQFGIFNLSLGEKKTTQFHTTYSLDHIVTAQVGAVNFTEHAVDVQMGYGNFAGSAGIQYGVVNVASHVAGMQIGVINLASTSSGGALGFFSLAMDNGGISYEGWADSEYNSYSSIKFRHSYTYSAIVFNNSHLDKYNVNKPSTGVGYIWGVHWKRGRYYLESDFGSLPQFVTKTVPDQSPSCQWDFQCSDKVSQVREKTWEIRAKLGYRILKHFSVVIGVGYNFSREERFLTAGFSFLQ
jgi:hypothetical protein